MKFLLTGANGYIGSNLAQLLNRSGHALTLTDIQNTDLQNYSKVDITRFEDLQELFLADGYDCVIHLAGEVGRLNGEEHPSAMVEINELGTLNLIRLCLRHQTSLLYVSTSEVYGSLAGSFTEELPTVDPHSTIPTNIYALSKLHAEHFVKHYAANYGLRAAIVRPFMVYGVGEPVNRYRSAMLNFIISVLAGKSIQVHKNTVRSWTYIDDIVRALEIVARSANFEDCQIFNLGRDEPHSMLEIARMIIAECDADEGLIQLVDPPSKFLTLEKHGDLRKAKELLGFTANIPVAEGIKRTVNWAKTLGEQIVVA